MKKLVALLLAFTLPAQAAVVLPHSFTAGQPIRSSEVNANDQALRDGINNHEGFPNVHHTTLAQILSNGNGVGAYNIDFNGKQAIGIRIENVVADPVASVANVGRVIYNTTTNLLRVDLGGSWRTIGGMNYPDLATILLNGNTAGTSNLDLNNNQLLNARAENLAGPPAAGEAGRLLFDTLDGHLKFDDGSAIQDLLFGLPPASGIAFTPAGGIAAGDVQAAIEEVDAEYQAADTTLQGNIDAEATARTTHEALTTTAHGGIVPSTRTINGYDLSADRTLTPADIGADVAGSSATVQTNLNTHTARTDNPHSVTKTQVGLSNVPNVDTTNPANITQDATHQFMTNTERSNWDNHRLSTTNPHSTTASQVGAPSLILWGTKGNVVVGDDVGSPGILGVGMDGQVLTADSAQTLGVKWADAAAGGGGGGGGSLQWIEDANAPMPVILYSMRAFAFGNQLDQELWTAIRVPSSYTVGNPITLKSLWMSNASGGNILLQTTAYLIRASVDLYYSETTSRISSNTVVGMSGASAGKMLPVSFDLTDASGLLGGLQVQPGDLIKVKLYRSSGYSTSYDANVFAFASEVTFQ